MKGSDFISHDIHHAYVTFSLTFTIHIFLLLKYICVIYICTDVSFFIHNVSRYDACSENDEMTSSSSEVATIVETVETDVSSTISKEEETSEEEMTTSHLVLRRWCDLYPSQEFRCVVRGGRLIGMSQRICDRCFNNMSNNIDILTEAVHQFYSTILAPAISKGKRRRRRERVCVCERETR